MIWKSMVCALAATLMSGAAYAQMEGEEDPAAAEWAYQLEMNDHDQDGKISRAEIKKTAEADAEGATADEKLDTYGDYLIQFLATDADDDDVVTEKEFLKSYASSEEGTKLKLSASDWKAIEKEYIEPSLGLMHKEHDKDGDKAISTAEAEGMDDLGEDEFKQFDTDKDGKLSIDEFKAAFRTMMEQGYDIEDGVAAIEEPEISPENLKKAKEAFGSMDPDGDGTITKAEFKSLEKDEEESHWWGRYIAYLAMDGNDDLDVSFDEFLKFGLAKRAGEKVNLYPIDKKEALKEVWSGLDADEDGKVMADEFKKAFPSSDEFPGADTDKNGELSKDEFWALLEPTLTKDFEMVAKDKPSKSAVKPVEEEDKAGEGESNSADETDVYLLYKKQGRSWTLKMSNAGMEIYIKTEVLEVKENSAKIRVSTLDKDGNAFMGAQPTESEIEFVKSDESGDANDNVEIVEKTIKTEAGEFECIGYKMGDKEVDTWIHKKYRSLLVKNNSLELVEFEE